MRHRLLELANWAASKRPPRRYVLAASAVLAAILVGVVAAPLAMSRFSGQDVGAPALHIDGHFALMTSDGRAVTDQPSEANGWSSISATRSVPISARPR
jgi:hypothetical protein